MNTNKSLIIATCCIGLASLAWAQGKPADKPTPPPAAPPGAAAKGAEHMEHMGKPGEHEHMMEHGGKPGEHEHEHMGKPGEAGPAAQGAPDMAMPKPAPELEAAFKFYEGAWKCDSKFPAGSMGPGSPEQTAKTTIRFKKAAHGFYYQGDYEVKKTKTMPGMRGTIMISYQPAAKVFVMTSSDDMGSAEYVTSAGFSGDAIVFTGEGYMMGQKMKIRETMTKTDKEAGHKVEVDMGKGFQSMGEDSCKR